MQGVLARTLDVRRAAGVEHGHRATVGEQGLQLVASSDVLLDPPAAGPVFRRGWIAKGGRRRPWRRLLASDTERPMAALTLGGLE